MDCLDADKINATKICSAEIDAVQFLGNSASINDLCVSGSIKATNAGAINLNANNLCAQAGTINKLCVNDLTVQNMNSCVKWRAAATLSTNSTYTLGTNVNWNVTLDDPNNNVTLSPFAYTVPVSGYYLISYYLNCDSLSGASVITGIPIGLLTISVNNVELRQAQAPYLSFSVLQKGNLSALVMLNAGDVVRMKYDVLAFDANLGLVPFVGTVSLKGNGLFPGQSGFEIHYLSSLVCMPGGSCQICPPVIVSCQPNMINCTPCSNC